jgi:hypothetical protein
MVKVTLAPKKFTLKITRGTKMNITSVKNINGLEVKIKFHILELMKVEMISWTIYATMDY